MSEEVLQQELTKEVLQQELTKAQEMIGALQEELARTNSELLALTLELEERVDERTAQLETSRTSFHSIVEKSADGIIIVDKKGLTRFVNQTTEVFFGCQREKLINKSFDFPVVVGEVRELDIIREDGKTGVGEMRVVQTQWEGKVAYLVSVRDITERLRAVKAAEKSKMEAMVESMSEGAIMTDESGKLIVINPAARRLLGFKPDEEITSEKLIGSFKDVEMSKLFGKGIDFAEEEVSMEINISNPQPRILYASQALVKDEGEKKLGYVTIIRDITREKEVDRMKTEFISTVSHELKTPLAITKEGVSLVLDKILGKINEKQEEILTLARDNIDRLARIINSLLDISKIEAGKVELKRKLINIINLIKEVTSSFELKAKEKGLQLRVNLPPQGIDVYADPDKVVQVFTNLIGNALKFTEEGYIEISAREKNEDMVECSVADTGIGISKEDLPKVFKRFQQFERVDGAGEKGTGLGLAITKDIIKMHQSEIWVESKFGKGTKFTFTLPKYTAERNSGGDYDQSRKARDNG